MKRAVAAVLVVMMALIGGCSQKFVTINLEEGANLEFNGDVSPNLFREGTDESVAPTFKIADEVKLQ